MFGSRLSNVVVTSVPFTLTLVSSIVGCTSVEYTNPCSVLVELSQFSETILITPFKVADVSVTLVTAEVVNVGL